MTEWLVVAPERDDDDALRSSSWVARQTILCAPSAPGELVGPAAVRAAFEQYFATKPQLTGISFFGHGAPDRLLDANRAPGTHGPALIDGDNVGLLRGCWVHAFACWSGAELATRAVEQGAAVYVGYDDPLDAHWLCPPWAEREFVDLVTCVTLALLAGERDERALKTRAGYAADKFFHAFESNPNAQEWSGYMWLHKLSQALVDNLVVALPKGAAPP